MKSLVFTLPGVLVLAVVHVHAQEPEYFRDVIDTRRDGVALTMDIFKPSKPQRRRHRRDRQRGLAGRVQKGKWSAYPRLGAGTKGLIGFQDHGHTVASRNVNIFPLSRPPKD